MITELTKKIESNILKITFIEKRFNKKDFLLNNINFWPLIRLQFFQGTQIERKKKRILNFFFNFFLQKLLIFINHFFNYFFYKIKLKKIKKLNIKHLFFSDKKFYYNKFKGKYINNLIDPYFDLLTNEKKLKIEIIQNVIPNKPKLFKPTYLKSLQHRYIKFNFL